MKIEKGSMVQVFRDPLTCERLEAVARVTKVIQREDWTDVAGNQIVRCMVRIGRECYERDVSQLTANNPGGN